MTIIVHQTNLFLDNETDRDVRLFGNAPIIGKHIFVLHYHTCINVTRYIVM